MRTLFWLVLISLVVAGVVVGQEQAGQEPVAEDEAALMSNSLPEEALIAPEEVRYSVVDEEDIPEHILQIIGETRANATSMVFDGESGIKYVYIALGERSTGGYHINIESVERAGDRVSVLYSEIKPGEDEMVTQALTYPWTVLKVHSELPIDVTAPEAGAIAE